MVGLGGFLIKMLWSIGHTRWPLMNVKAHPPMHRHLFLGGSCPLPAQPKGGGGTPPILPPQALKTVVTEIGTISTIVMTLTKTTICNTKFSYCRHWPYNKTSGHYSILTNDYAPQIAPWGIRPLNKWFLVPIQVHTPNGILVGSAVFAHLVDISNR